MSKRIDLNKFDLKHSNTLDLEDEIKDNLYYNQIWFWCSDCNRKHRVGLSPFGHPVKPIPVKCEVDGDHCWKGIGQIKYIGLDIRKDWCIPLREGYIIECVICGKKGIKESMTLLTNNMNITTIQLKQLNKYIQSVKDVGFKKLNEMPCKRYKNLADGGIIFLRIPEIDKKIREIQGMQDYIVINKF